MTEVRDYVQLNTQLIDLAIYGEQHDDAWVRRLGSLVREIHEAIKSTEYYDIYSLEDLVEKFRQELNEFESSMRTAEYDREEEHDLRIRAEEKYESLRYDLDKDEQACLIQHLKADIISRDDTIRRNNQREAKKEQTIRELERRLAETEEKLNMWTIMNRV